MKTEKRKLIKFSNYSLCITLPKWVVNNFKWKKGDIVNVKIDSESAKIIVYNGKKPIVLKTASKKTVDEKDSNNLRW